MCSLGRPCTLTSCQCVLTLGEDSYMFLALGWYGTVLSQVGYSTCWEEYVC